MSRALIVIDVQNDFCDGGVLAARDAATLIAPLNRMIGLCESRGILCIFTRDWHPPNHYSFQARGGPWPVHCVQGSVGAEFVAGLRFPAGSPVIDIETDPDLANTGYSAFENTTLESELRGRGVEEIALCGIATEYCVKATAVDALQLGFRTTVLVDLIRPINLAPRDAEAALHEMEIRGAMLLSSAAWGIRKS